MAAPPDVCDIELAAINIVVNQNLVEFEADVLKNRVPEIFLEDLITARYRANIAFHIARVLTSYEDSTPDYTASDVGTYDLFQRIAKGVSKIDRPFSEIYAHLDRNSFTFKYYKERVNEKIKEDLHKNLSKVA